MSYRLARGEGKDMGGTDKMDRTRVMQSGMDADAWRADMDAMRSKQKGTTGIYNPKSGEREYSARHSGPQKNMTGRTFGGSPESMAKRLAKKR